MTAVPANKSKVKKMPEPNAIRRVVTATTEATFGAAVELCLGADVALVVVWDGSGRLIDLCGDCYGLPLVSTKLLEIALRRGTKAAANQLAIESTVPNERAKADADSFLGGLLRRGLLVRADKRVSRTGLTSRLKARALAGVLRFVLRAFRSDSGRAGALLATAYACLKLLGWARTVELWQSVLGTTPAFTEEIDELGCLDSIERTVRDALSRSLFPVDCKARALCSWAMLRSAGRPARVVVGIDLFPFLGHCWCESGSRVLGDGSGRSGRFTPVLQYS
jgi:Transglutaminase-like superfamily